MMTRALCVGAVLLAACGGGDAHFNCDVNTQSVVECVEYSVPSGKLTEAEDACRSVGGDVIQTSCSTSGSFGLCSGLDEGSGATASTWLFACDATPDAASAAAACASMGGHWHAS